jgi:hypothetical protein
VEYEGKSRRARVRIIAESGWLAGYNGQECNAILYDSGPRPQIDTEQLKPPLPSWQSANWADIQEIGRPR